MNWIFIGTGWMAEQMAKALKEIDGQTIVGAHSRDAKKLEAFAADHNITHYSTDVNDVLKNNQAHALYISTPHTSHFDWAKWGLQNNLHVLVEKPATLKGEDWDTLCKLAKEKKKTLLEGMWMSFFPALKELGERFKSGKLGAIKNIKADFCINPEFNADSRLWKKELAGGAAWDLGIYNLNLLYLFFRQEDVIINTITKELSITGVDQHNQIFFDLPQNGKAKINFSLDREMPQDAFIEFEKGTCRIPNFFHPNELIWDRDGMVFHHNFEKEKGYHYQIEAFLNTIFDGQCEVEENDFQMTGDRIRWIEGYLKD